MFEKLKKYRRFTNIGLIATLTIMTVVLFVTVLTTDALLTLRHYIGIGFTVVTLATLFTSRNTFTLLLGLTLIIGNFCGLSSLHTITTSSFKFNKIPLYWGQPEYTLMLIIYLLFNRGFFIGISTKEYWQEFTTRANDLEQIIKPDLNADVQIINPELSIDKINEFKNRYLDYPTEKLIEISNDTRFSKAAKKAAAEIIAERLAIDTNESTKS